MKSIGKFYSDERGTQIVELAIMIGIIALATMATVGSVGIGLAAWRKRRRMF